MLVSSMNGTSFGSTSDPSRPLDAKCLSTQPLLSSATTIFQKIKMKKFKTESNDEWLPVRCLPLSFNSPAHSLPRAVKFLILLTIVARLPVLCSSSLPVSSSPATVLPPNSTCFPFLDVNNSLKKSLDYFFFTATHSGG